MNALLLTLAATILVSAAPQEPAKPRVLIVTGVDYPGHPWKETAPALRNILEQGQACEVRIIEDHEFLASDAIFDYDVLLLHFKNYQPVARAGRVRENLVKFVKDGRGLVALHFACGAFEDWPEFSDLVGRVWDRKNAHDPRGAFKVEIVNPEHPITRGMKDFEADDELYICLAGERPITTLAAARSKVTGKDHPMAFVFEYGKGRVFHSPLGHDVKALEMPGVAELFRRGTLWSAGRLP